MSVPPAVPGALGPGDRLGPYRIVCALGAGGMGTVYQAEDEVLGRSVAVKVINPSLADDPVFRDRFTREARAQASLDSPHVVQVFAHGEADGHLYIATQLVPDGDLGAMLRLHGAPPPRIAVDLIAQIADGLAEAHRVGLVHRDIKPANVLVRNRGDALSAYLTDFGIARQVQGEGLTTEGFAVGTPAYMAPELHTGGHPGPASDVYALGCLLWAALVGRAPYAGTTDYQVVDAHVSAPVPQLAERGPFEREVNRVLRTAMAKDPAQRYAAAAQLREELRALERMAVPATVAAAGEPRAVTTAAAPTTFAAPAPVGRRRTALVVVATVLAVVLVGGGVAAAVVATRGNGSSGGDGGGAGGGGTSSAERQQAIDNIAASLESDGNLDAAAARCTAEKLVDKRGVDGLRQAGLIGEDLRLRTDSSGHVAPDVLADVFTSSFNCLWSSSATAS